MGSFERLKHSTGTITVEFRTKKMNFWTNFTFWMVLAIQLLVCLSNPTSNDIPTNDTNSNEDEVTTISTTDNLMDIISNFINNVIAIFTGRNTPETELRSGQSMGEQLLFKIPLVNVEVTRGLVESFVADSLEVYRKWRNP